MLEDFQNYSEKDTDCVFTDKLPEVTFTLFKGLVRKGGLLVFYNPHDMSYFESITSKKLIYNSKEDDESFAIIFF
jgi:hypothetical protein